MYLDIYILAWDAIYQQFFDNITDLNFVMMAHHAWTVIYGPDNNYSPIC